MSLLVIENILKESTIKKISNQVDNLYQNKIKSNFKKNLQIWPSKIVEFSKEVLIYSLDIQSEEYYLIETDLKKLNTNKSIKSILYYYWMPGSYIPWHTDGVYSNTLTIYLNDTWDYTWGGLFQYQDNDTINTIIPKFNQGILQQGKIEHSTTITTTASPIRKTIQVFFSNNDINYGII